MNNETYTAFKKMLEAVMTIVRKIKDPRYGVSKDMPILNFVERYNIDCAKNSLIEIEVRN